MKIIFALKGHMEFQTHATLPVTVVKIQKFQVAVGYQQFYDEHLTLGDKEVNESGVDQMLD